MLSFLYVYSDHSILECYNLFSGVELSMRSFFVIIKFRQVLFDVQAGNSNLAKSLSENSDHAMYEDENLNRVLLSLQNYPN